MNKSTKFNNPKKSLMIQALTKSLGNVSTACKVVDIDRATHYNWLESDENYKNEVESISDYSLDFVESKLIENINDKKESSIFFYLKCKGKKRGWIEKSEVQNTNINYNQEMTDEQMNDVLDKLKRMTE